MLIPPSTTAIASRNAAFVHFLVMRGMRGLRLAGCGSVAAGEMGIEPVFRTGLKADVGDPTAVMSSTCPSSAASFLLILLPLRPAVVNSRTPPTERLLIPCRFRTLCGCEAFAGPLPPLLRCYPARIRSKPS